MPYKNGNKVYNEGVDNRTKHKCLNCFKIFKNYSKNSKYCSNKCYHKAEKINRIGLGNPMYGKKWSEKHLEEHIKRTKGKLPKNYKLFRQRSLENAKLNPRRGDKNNMWKGGITPANRLLRQSLRYNNWRNKVYRKNYWTCVDCKIKCTSRSIVAHHIKSFSEYPKLRFLVSNGLTLCRKCHIKLHRDLLLSSRKYQNEKRT